MIVLRTTKSSPYGRKCWMAALRLGLMDRIQLVNADYLKPDDPVHAENPLGKVPVLTTEEGEHIFDSPVILEYLDHLAGPGKLIPTAWPERLANLKMQALADGIADAAVLIAMERVRPRELWHMPSVERQRMKIARGLQEAEQQLPDPSVIQLGAIALAAAIGYVDRRGPYDWRKHHPVLVTWLDAFRAHAPEFDQTYLPPEPGYVSP